jgi:hypothetical protein
VVRWHECCLLHRVDAHEHDGAWAVAACTHDAQHSSATVLFVGGGGLTVIAASVRTTLERHTTAYTGHTGHVGGASTTAVHCRRTFAMRLTFIGTWPLHLPQEGQRGWRGENVHVPDGEQPACNVDECQQCSAPPCIITDLRGDSTR